MTHDQSDFFHTPPSKFRSTFLRIIFAPFRTPKSLRILTHPTPSQGGRKPIASCQRKIWSRHFLQNIFEKVHTPTSISVYTMKSQGIGGVVGRGEGFFDAGALQRFLPPCPVQKR